jgi:hypothetical protein
MIGESEYWEQYIELMPASAFGRTFAGYEWPTWAQSCRDNPLGLSSLRAKTKTNTHQ